MIAKIMYDHTGPTDKIEEDAMNLKDKVVLITGGGTGLGKAISLAMAAEGANIAVAYSRSEGDANNTVNDIKEHGVKAAAFKADVRDSKSVDTMVSKVTDEFGRIDVLVNNAGISVLIPFEDLDGVKDSDWDNLLATNVKGPFHCIKAVVPIMKKQGGGRIVNIGTSSAIRPEGSSIPYVASKAALHHMSVCLARAFAPNITVNVVAAGTMPTRWWTLLTGKPDTEERKQHAREENPLKRFAEPDDVAAAVVMTAKNDSMSGEVVVVDAGFCLRT